MIKIGLTGASGKVGLQIIKEIKNFSRQFEITQALVNPSKPLNLEVKKGTKQIIHEVSLFNNINVIIDFSTPTLTLNILEHALKNKIPLVIGTTGFNDNQKSKFIKASKEIPILISPNMSLSVNFIFKLVAIVAQNLPNFEAEIIEAHHRYKKDSPSGTALKMGEMIAEARNIDFKTHAKFSRYGVNEERKADDIGFAVIRGGDIIGEHEAQFLSDGEILSLKSTITNRASFANGALMAANFIIKKQPGLYSMLDALGLNSI